MWEDANMEANDADTKTPLGEAPERSPKAEAEESFQRGYRLQMSGRLKEAIESYQHSIDLVPSAEAHTFMGWAYSFLGQLDRAIEHCRTAIELDPEFGNPYNDIGAYLIQQGEYEEAIPYLERALEATRYASKHFPHYNLARIYERQGKWFEALDEYKRALALEPDYTLAKEARYRLQALMN